MTLKHHPSKRNWSILFSSLCFGPEYFKEEKEGEDKIERGNKNSDVVNARERGREDFFPHSSLFFPLLLFHTIFSLACSSISLSHHTPGFAMVNSGCKIWLTVEFWNKQTMGFNLCPECECQFSSKSIKRKLL
jgi:hypothetical protein